jgi:sec-independent protein translocase protein TatA
MNNLYAFMGLGPMELLIVAAIVLLLFGSRLPSVMRNLGRGIVEFKKGTREIEDDIDQAGRGGDE